MLSKLRRWVAFASKHRLEIGDLGSHLRKLASNLVRKVGIDVVGARLIASTHDRRSADSGQKSRLGTLSEDDEAGVPYEFVPLAVVQCPTWADVMHEHAGRFRSQPRTPQDDTWPDVWVPLRVRFDDLLQEALPLLEARSLVAQLRSFRIERRKPLVELDDHGIDPLMLNLSGALQWDREVEKSVGHAAHTNAPRGCVSGAAVAVETGAGGTDRLLHTCCRASRYLRQIAVHNPGRAVHNAEARVESGYSLGSSAPRRH
jgi:hypothetical protein